MAKKRKYFRKCGVCGARYEQSEMVRDIYSPNGWICHDCRSNVTFEFVEVELEDFDED